MPRKSTHKLDTFSNRLGKEPDHVIAAEAGVSRSLVIAFRKKLGIDAYDGYKFGAGNPPPAAVQKAAKAAAAPAKPAKAAKVAVAAAKPVKAAPVAAPKAAPVAAPVAAADDENFRGRRSALDAYVAMLGKVSDAEIAKLAGVTPENVRTFRTRRGIAANWPDAGKGKGGRPRGSLNKPKVAAADVAPKAAPAAKVAKVAAPKVAAPVVAAKAAPAKASAPAPVAAPSVAAPAAKTGVRSVFSVSVDVGGVVRTYAVLGSNIAEGVASANALVAARHPAAVVRGVSYVAELLG